MIFLDFLDSKNIKPGQKISPKEAMELAISEARKGLGRVSPNPPVGCVILDKDQKFLAKGYHKAYGENHAEIEALKQIKNKKLLKKASLYVTLEPCAHQGKTPSCVETLLKYPFKTVIYGDKDPNPKTCGKSLKLLEKYQIKTKKFDFYQEEIQKLYEVFSFNMKFRKTFVGLKVASSLDGMIAFSDGRSQWITCEKSRDQVSYLRGCYDGVLIGRDTFLQDNPRLNSRHPLFCDKTNKVVILDPEGRCAEYIAGSRLTEVRDIKDIILVIGGSGFSNASFKILKAPFLKGKNSFHLENLLTRLYEDFHLSSLLVEGGAGVFSSFVEQNQIQRMYQFIGPVVMGGIKGRGWTESVCLNDMKKTLVDPECFKIGESVLITGRCPLY